jgi:hypothetical protein
VSEAIHQQGPEADSQQAFALRLQIFEHVHRRFRRASWTNSVCERRRAFSARIICYSPNNRIPPGGRTTIR